MESIKLNGWLSILATILACAPLYAQGQTVGEARRLIFHDIRADKAGHILPWFSDEPGTAYDHVLNLVWTYWKNMPNYHSHDGEFRRRYSAVVRNQGYEAPPGVKKYLLYRTLDDPGIGGDQFAMMLSSWSLYYAYTGDKAVLDDMVFQADTYLANGLSAPDAGWPDIPYPCNTSPNLLVYDGDLISGKGYTQPDKAGSFGAELVTLFKVTGNRKYLDGARKMADTLARHTQPGDADHSPLPFRVHALTGDVKAAYTSNWTGTLRLFDQLIAMDEGDVASYRKSHALISRWLKQFPMRTNKWGPFFEDIGAWSDTGINAGTLAWYMLENPTWEPEWKLAARAIQDWVIGRLTIRHWQPLYGLTVIGEQTVYNMQGQSHTSRHASIELRYAELTGYASRKAESIQQLNWATYMVDVDGKNRYPDFTTYEIWWTDGYGDYVRHYLRAMGAAPELAPPGQNHLLRTSSVCRSATYERGRTRYRTFDNAATDVLRLAFRPVVVLAGGSRLSERKTLDGEGWTWQPLADGGVLRVRHERSGSVEIRIK